MMKQQPYVTSLPPCKLCRLLILAFTVKLLVLGLLIFEPVLLPGGIPGLPAFAATQEGVGASPVLEATLPDVGMNRPTPGMGGLDEGGVPGASSGVTASLTTPQLEAEPTRSLPVISGGGAPKAAGQPVDNAETRDSLLRRQEDLARKEQELKVLENELGTRLEKMQMLENRLQTMIKDAEQSTDAKFRHLVDVLSNMKAKQAALVLETLDPKIAVRVLAGMRGRQAGEILTNVKAEKAAMLTESLAQMQLPLE